MTTTSLPTAQKTAHAVIFAVAVCHLINDVMQSLLTAIYPILKQTHGLDFVQVGLLSFTFRVTASLLQPVIGFQTDRRPQPYSLAVGMGFTLVGLVMLGFAGNYALLLAGAAAVGLGSAVFHPESSRRRGWPRADATASRNRPSRWAAMPARAIGPLLAAFVVVPRARARGVVRLRGAHRHGRPRPGGALVRRPPA